LLLPLPFLQKLSLLYRVKTRLLLTLSQSLLHLLHLHRRDPHLLPKLLLHPTRLPHLLKTLQMLHLLHLQHLLLGLL
jgi:hypothetical protein